VNPALGENYACRTSPLPDLSASSSRGQFLCDLCDVLALVSRAGEFILAQHPRSPRDCVSAFNPFIFTSVSVIVICLLDKSDGVSENKFRYQIVFIYDFVIS